MPFLVEFRHYDYADWYPDWVEPPETAEKEKFKESLMGPLLGDDKFWNSRTEFTIDSVYPNPFVFVHFRTSFSIHNALKTIIHILRLYSVSNLLAASFKGQNLPKLKEISITSIAVLGADKF